MAILVFTLCIWLGLAPAIISEVARQPTDDASIGLVPMAFVGYLAGTAVAAALLMRTRRYRETPPHSLMKLAAISVLPAAVLPRIVYGHLASDPWFRGNDVVGAIFIGVIGAALGLCGAGLGTLRRSSGGHGL